MNLICSIYPYGTGRPVSIIYRYGAGGIGALYMAYQQLKTVGEEVFLMLNIKTDSLYPQENCRHHITTGAAVRDIISIIPKIS